MIRKTYTHLAISVLMIALFYTAALAQPEAGRMTKEDLMAQLDDPKTFVIDVRSGRDWTSSKEKIKGALRVEVREATTAVKSFDKDKTYIFYCS